MSVTQTATTDFGRRHSLIQRAEETYQDAQVNLPGSTFLISLMPFAVVWNQSRFGVWAPIALTVALQGIWDLLYAPWTYNMVAEYACIALLYGAVHFRVQPAEP